MKKIAHILIINCPRLLRVLLLLGGQELSIINSSAQSPSWLWAKAMGGANDDYSNSVAVDASGNVYTTGSFQGIADFDPGPGTFNLTSTGQEDIFISKLDGSGNFVWAKAMGGIGHDHGTSIAIDIAGSGDVYTTGLFYGTADFDPGAGVFNLTSAGGSGDGDIFISKLDSSGNFVWAKSMGGTASWDIGNAIAIDPAGSGDVYTTGDFWGTVDFDPGAGTFNLISADAYDIFISKLDSSGNFVWAKAMGGIFNQQSFSIALDPAGSGDVYTTGSFQGSADFDPGAGVFNLTSPGGSSEDIFISKLDSSGNFVWAKAMGGISSDVGFSIALDPAGSGDVYTTGSFSGPADFDPGTGTFNLTGEAVFISKLNSSGNFVWAKALGAYTSYSIALDTAGGGGVYTTGRLWATADLDPGAGVFNLTSAGDDDIFISKLDNSGNFVWAKAAGGTEEDFGRAIALDASGNVYMTGIFESSSITFGTTTLTNSNVYYPEIFIARLDRLSIPIGINTPVNVDDGVLIFPNPVINTAIISFSLNQSEKVSIKIFDVNGSLVSDLSDKIVAEGINEIVWNVEDINAGIYFLRVDAEDFSRTEKISLVK